ncbi:MAG: hypothetical protein U9R12_03490 [Candidatus Caldatribacteriota bacterium]|nr:hypothetical protein [Candidatus Caldatribacteriota bacterium]
MDVKAFALDKIISWILGGTIFADIKKVVGVLANEDMAGAEKKEEAIKRLKTMGVVIATFLMNLGIEVAVTLLKAQQSKDGELKPLS